jgi:hypothetical protein
LIENFSIIKTFVLILPWQESRESLKFQKLFTINQKQKDDFVIQKILAFTIFQHSAEYENVFV